ARGFGYLYTRLILVKEMGKKILTLIGFFMLFGLSSCMEERNLYKDYASSNLVAKEIPLNHDDNNGGYGYPTLWDEVYIISTFESFEEYKFKLVYTEEFFEDKELLVFSVTCCSSDDMKFKDILLKEGKLYPIYTRRRIGKNEFVTEDFIVLPYFVELEKSDSYQAGEILFEYHK
nr:hypothetical protein [Anaeroplasmataceae bacterium]